MTTTTLAILPAFLAPGLAAAGAAAVAIPIAIHILSRRPRKPVPWAAMRFILAAYRRHRVRTRFEQYLLLAVRCLLILLIGLALAGPLGSAAGLGGLGGRTVVMVLDNSLTSGAQDSAGARRFDQLRSAAQKMVTSLHPGDRVALVTASRPVQALVWPPTSDPQAVLHQVQLMGVTPAAADIPGALKLVTHRLEQLDQGKRPTYVALLSDFSAGAVRLDRPLPRELSRLGEMATLLHVSPAAAASNIQIASLEPDRRMVLTEPGGGASVNWLLKLRRFGPLPTGNVVTPVRLTAPGVAPNRIDVRWKPGESQSPEIAVNMPLGDGGAAGAGLLHVEASLEPTTANALDADDTRRSLVRVRQHLSILLVGRHEPDAAKFTPRLWLTTALAPVADRLGWPLEIHEVDAAAVESDPDGLPKSDVAIVLRPDLLSESGWSALRQWTEGGGLAWFLTPPRKSATLWPTQLAASMGLRWSIGSEPVKQDPPLTLSTDAAAPAGLTRLRAELPDLLRPIRVMERLPIDPATLGSGTDVMLAGAGGQPLLIGAGSPRGHGRVLLLATALDDAWTNLPTKPLFVPLLHELLRSTLDDLQNPNSYEPGDRPALVGPTWAHAAKLAGPEGEDLLLVPEGTEGPRGRGTKQEEGTSAPGPRVPGALGPSVIPIRPLVKPGLYRSATDALVVNVEADAGNTAATPGASLKSWLAAAGTWKPIAESDPAAALRRAEQQPDLSWPLLWAVLGLAILETLLARRFSHAGTTHRTADATQAKPVDIAA